MLTQGEFPPSGPSSDPIGSKRNVGLRDAGNQTHGCFETLHQTSELSDAQVLERQHTPPFARSRLLSTQTRTQHRELKQYQGKYFREFMAILLDVPILFLMVVPPPAHSCGRFLNLCPIGNGRLNLISVFCVRG